MEFGSVGRGLGAVLQPGMTPLIMLLIKRCQSSAGRLAARSRFETARRNPANMSVMPLPRHALKMLTLRDDSDQCSVSGSTLLSRRVALGCVVLGPKRMPCAYVLPHSEKKSLSGRNRPSAPDCVMSWSARWREAVRRANRRRGAARRPRVLCLEEFPAERELRRKPLPPELPERCLHSRGGARRRVGIKELRNGPPAART